MVPARRFLFGGLTASVLVTGCKPKADAPAVTFADSAGVQVVRNAGSGLPTRFTWTVVPVPSVTIGESHGGEEYLLGSIRDLLRLQDGRTIVADAGSKTLRFYDPSGRHLRTVGREGAGPGEFRDIAGIALWKDTVLALDPSLGRFSRFGLDGSLHGSVLLAPTGSAIHPLGLYRLAGVTEGAALILVAAAYPANMRPKPVLAWDSVPTLLYGADGALRDTIGEFAGLDIYATPEEAGDVKFARATAAAVDSVRLYMTDGGDYTVRVYEPPDRLTRIVRLERDRRPVTRHDVELMFETSLARAAGDQARAARVRQHLTSWPRAQHKPWISRLLVDESGYLWVEEYAPHWDARARTWGVFDPDGRWLGTVQMPPGLRVMSIGRDYVAGVALDADDVESVQIYPLRRN